MPPETPSGASRHDRQERLAQRRARMPIIDRARTPPRSGRMPARAPWTYLWLRLLRPIAVTLFWLVVLRYAWTHLFGSADDLAWWQQAALYGVGVIAIVAAMLALAPLRRLEVRREPAGNTQPSSLEDLSEFSNFGPVELGELQHTRSMVMHHDESGTPDRADPRRSKHTA